MGFGLLHMTFHMLKILKASSKKYEIIIGYYGHFQSSWATTGHIGYKGFLGFFIFFFR